MIVHDSGLPAAPSPERTALSLKITPKQANGWVHAGSVPEKVADLVNGTRKKPRSQILRL
jgi:hypothetical protein